MTTVQSTIPEIAVSHRDRTTRWLPLAGVAYAALSVVGTLTIDRFPDENTSPQALVSYYATHHAQVGRGGQLVMLGSLFFGLFAAGLVARVRNHPGIAAVVAVGGAAALATDAQTNAIYALLGNVGGESHIDPAALQAWHIGGAAYGSNIPSVLFLLGVTLAGLAVRALPRWVGWTALVLAAGLLVPGLIGFFTSMLVWIWAVATGVAVARHPADEQVAA